MNTTEVQRQEGEDLQTFFKKLITRVSGLHAVLLSDRDGAQVLKVVGENYAEIQNENALAATFAVAAEQAGKLRLGKDKTITSFYEKHAIVHINDLPVIVSLIGDKQSNIGMVLAFVPDIKKALEPLRAAIVASEKTHHHHH